MEENRTQQTSQVAVVFDPNDSSSPYYVHLGENPSLVLVTTPLNETNYHTWSRTMKMALLSKNKHGFVDGTIKVPNKTEACYTAWERANNMVLSWILHSVIPIIAQSVLWLATAKEVWDDLKEHFSQGDIFRIADLRGEIYSIKQGDLSINEYFTRFKLLWDELLNLLPLPTCVCAQRCGCELLTKIQERHQQELVTTFLRCLSDVYGGVKSQIMVMTSLPKVGRVFSLVQQQEREAFHGNTGLGRIEDNSSMVLAAGPPVSSGMSFQRKFNSSNNKKVVCSFCGYTGHTVEKCYRIHGYPPGFKSRGKQNSNQRPAANFVGTLSNSDGSTKVTDGCFDVRVNSDFGVESKVNAIISSGNPQNSNLPAAAQPSKMKSAVYTTSRPMQDDNKGKLFSLYTDWIFDTGATDHIINFVSGLFNSFQVHNFSVVLPTGSKEVVTHIGSIKLTEHISLKGVLCVPGFEINLISVSKLAKDSGCSLSFFADYCVIQSGQDQKEIGLAKEDKGL
ncbi:PREDICTED: uncharacterized protein LOC109149920 [Ipomoea nil]|uniref:uncharacterized protein LOC109149920 n=1 Tax=Ipomoea nil TaxID=35883 RepID=UPI00090137BA|nr:PREDICTED: uncharacterized protein LOC109149920 [Ipomoea nil]